MPHLRNPRHEAFCQTYVNGPRAGNVTAAYAAAGYREDTGNASRLAKQPHIAKRVAELRARRDMQDRRDRERAIRKEARRKRAELMKLTRAVHANPLDYVQVAADGTFRVDAARVRKDRDLVERFTVETLPARNGRPAITRIKLRMADKIQPLTKLARELDGLQGVLAAKVRVRARA